MLSQIPFLLHHKDQICLALYSHIYDMIQDHPNTILTFLLWKKALDQFVQFEVMTGVEDIIERLAEARNTSVQVDEKSMAELQQKFDPIKEGLEGMPFFTRIAFKLNRCCIITH